MQKPLYCLLGFVVKGLIDLTSRLTLRKCSPGPAWDRLGKAYQAWNDSRHVNCRVCMEPEDKASPQGVLAERRDESELPVNLGWPLSDLLSTSAILAWQGMIIWTGVAFTLIFPDELHSLVSCSAELCVLLCSATFYIYIIIILYYYIILIILYYYIFFSLKIMSPAWIMNVELKCPLKVTFPPNLTSAAEKHKCTLGSIVANATIQCPESIMCRSYLKYCNRTRAQYSLGMVRLPQ